MQCTEVKEIGENEDEESHQNTSEERKENIYIKREKTSNSGPDQGKRTDRQRMDGWMLDSLTSTPAEIRHPSWPPPLW
jgi:hypothetical protein